MSKWTFLASFPALVLVALCGCDVQVHDETPASYPANHGVGMYEMKMNVARDFLVQDGTVVVFALGGKERLQLTGNPDQSEFQGLFSARCVPSFPVQYQVIWRLQGSSARSMLVPPQPRQVQLVPPPLTGEVTIDTSAKSTKGWEGGVPYTFITAEHAQIKEAHIEPLSQSAEDVAAAKAINVESPMPVDLPCAVPTEVRLSSKLQRAQGNLVIETDQPQQAHWQTKVTFAPQGGAAEAPAAPPPAAPKKKKRR